MPHIFVLKVEHRNELRGFLEQNDIESGIHYKPNHMLTKYIGSGALPISEALYSQLISLPCHYDLSDEDLYFVCNKMQEFYVNA